MPILVMVMMAFCPSGILGLLERVIKAVSFAAKAARAGLAAGEDEPMSAVLEVAKLSKHFGGITAVDDVSFEVQEGEILGIIGPNGSGKSTLFNCVLGQLTPNEGEVRVDGRRDHRHAPLRYQPPGRQPYLPAAAGVSAAFGARQSHPRRPGASGLDVLAPDRRAPTRGSAKRPSG